LLFGQPCIAFVCSYWKRKAPQQYNVRCTGTDVGNLIFTSLFVFPGGRKAL